MGSISSQAYLGLAGRNETFDIAGASGVAYVNGFDGRDYINLLFGDDTGFGGLGSDVVMGFSGNDTLYGDQFWNDETTNVDPNLAAAADLILGDRANGLGSGNDTIYGGAGANYANGGGGDDAIFGGSGNEYLQGGTGNDVVFGLGGNDIIFGGTGSNSEQDAFITISIGPTLTLTFDGVTDVNQSQTYSLLDASGQVAVTGTGDDYLDGGAGDDTIYGQDGIDRLMGGDGSDVLNGGAGADTMSGNQGSDTYVVDSLGDIVNELNEAGLDTIYASVDYKLGAFQDNLFQFGASIYGTGNAGDNYIIGNEQGNIINGLGGLDNLTGGAGSDIFQMVGNFGTQVITDFVAGAGTQDAVTFSTARITSFATVLANSAQIGGDTYIGDGLGNQVVLVGVNRAALSGDDFGFF